MFNIYLEDTHWVIICCWLTQSLCSPVSQRLGLHPLLPGGWQGPEHLSRAHERRAAWGFVSACTCPHPDRGSLAAQSACQDRGWVPVFFQQPYPLGMVPAIFLYMYWFQHFWFYFYWVAWQSEMLCTSNYISFCLWDNFLYVSCLMCFCLQSHHFWNSFICECGFIILGVFAMCQVCWM